MANALENKTKGYENQHPKQEVGKGRKPSTPNPGALLKANSHRKEPEIKKIIASQTTAVGQTTFGETKDHRSNRTVVRQKNRPRKILRNPPHGPWHAHDYTLAPLLSRQKPFLARVALLESSPLGGGKGARESAKNFIRLPAAPWDLSKASKSPGFPARYLPTACWGLARGRATMQ